ncbi:GNAT family N-acetyltransferase [Hymenobacter cellulosilyticus]|uniref:GNAT family N-acetyltransferase n=1 Tax=Hymenobacter cellulosilyticus TaxID=2932248 RepID=A0A8T9Q6B6_9BACT|nr:GNAT family protein [Hymenobacter cellulosilyticus]UOQ71538.1 GNAT family N-acetyltransferase [Hymenobacter cellulosilyticus]
MNTPTVFALTTSRLCLRPLQPTDLAAFAAHRTAGEQQVRYHRWEPDATAGPADFLTGYAQAPVPALPGSWATLGVAERATATLLGMCALRLEPQQPRTAEIGITLVAAAQGRGYALEAAHRLLRYCFEDLKLHRVVATTDCLNHPGARLLERLGMRREAHFRKNAWCQGAWADEYLYALLFEEWDSWQLQ